MPASTTLHELSEQLRQTAYRVGAEQIKRRISSAQLVARLTEVGLDPVSASTVAGELTVMKKHYQRHAGKRGAIETVTIDAGTNQQRGYVAVFVRNNVIVILTEIGPGNEATADRLETHARIIEGRVH